MTTNEGADMETITDPAAIRATDEPDERTTPAPVSGAGLDLDVIEAREKAATPGPWSAADEHGLLGPDAHPAWCISRMRPGYGSMTPTDGYMHDVAEIVHDGPMEADAEFIAHAREDVPALVAEVRRLWLSHGPALFEESMTAILHRAESAEAEVVTLLDTLGRRTDSHTQLRRDNDTLRAKVAVVEAFLDDAEIWHNDRVNATHIRDNLRAALATTGEGQ